MIAQSRRSTAVRALYAVMLLVASVTAAGTSVAADIRGFSSGAPADVAKLLAEKFTRDTGHRVEFTVANPAGIQRKLCGRRDARYSAPAGAGHRGIAEGPAPCGPAAAPIWRAWAWAS